jgi:hypothetical protein
MEAKRRITLAITLVLIVVAAMSREFLWITLPLTLFAIFLFVWGREEHRTENVISRMPVVGKYMLKPLEQIDSIISPRDQARILANHLSQFVADGLIEFPKNGPGWIKADLRRVVGRTLDKLGP